MMGIVCPQRYNWSFASSASNNSSRRYYVFILAGPRQKCRLHDTDFSYKVWKISASIPSPSPSPSFLASNFLFDLLSQQFGPNDVRVNNDSWSSACVWDLVFRLLMFTRILGRILMSCRCSLATGSLWVLAVNGAERALPSKAISSSVSLSFVLFTFFITDEMV